MEPEPKRERGGKKALLLAVNLVLVLGIVLGTWHVVSPRSSPLNHLLTGEVLPALPRERQPVTLDPVLFSGDVAEAYRIAKQRPELLERMPCYCGCYWKQGHQNSLDCFASRHSENCPMCVAIAREAARLEDQGYAADDIKTIIDRRFSKRAENR